MSVTCILTTHRTIALVIGAACVRIARLVHEPYDLLDVAPGGDSCAEKYREEKEGKHQSNLSVLIPGVPVTASIVNSGVF